MLLDLIYIGSCGIVLLKMNFLFLKSGKMTDKKGTFFVYLAKCERGFTFSLIATCLIGIFGGVTEKWLKYQNNKRAACEN
jgi:hypothetical protein